MLYESCYRIDDQVLTTLSKRELMELEEHYSMCALNDIVKRMVRDGTIYPEKLYTFRYEKRNKRCYTPWGEEEVTALAVKINPAKEEITHIKTLEETHLASTKSFKEKIRNCIRYLKAR